jgi:hypothetical protein
VSASKSVTVSATWAARTLAQTLRVTRR